MPQRTMDIEDEPLPPYPESTLKKIGEFFYLFSIVEEWICVYLKSNGGYSSDDIIDLSISRIVHEWTKIAFEKEPNNLGIISLSDAFNDLRMYRNAIAHAWWREHKEQLHGSFTRRSDQKVITISGDAHLDEMIAQARYCTAIIDFWDFS